MKQAWSPLSLLLTYALAGCAALPTVQWHLKPASMHIDRANAKLVKDGQDRIYLTVTNTTTKPIELSAIRMNQARRRVLGIFERPVDADDDALQLEFKPVLFLRPGQSVLKRLSDFKAANSSALDCRLPLSVELRLGPDRGWQGPIELPLPPPSHWPAHWEQDCPGTG